MPIQPAGEVEFQQHPLHRAAARAGQADEFVDGHRRGSEQLLDLR
jgi:hypothetical protein